MHFRKLANSDLPCSVIGYGTWGIGGSTPGPTSYGEISKQQAIECLNQAINSQINFFDTSSVYGYGASEKLIGRVLHACREKVIIATKAGMESYQSPLDFSSATLEQSLDRSLIRLKTEYVDIFQLHNPTVDAFKDNPDLSHYLNSEIDRGRAKHIGISSKSPTEAFQLLKAYPFSSVQVNLNLLDTRAIDCGLLDYCQSRNITVMIRTPLCFGFLANNINHHTHFKQDDHRSNWTIEQKRLWSEGADIAHQLYVQHQMLEDNISDAMNAIRFCYHHPAVSTVLTGGLSVLEVQENAKAGELSAFPEHAYQAVLKLNTEKSFFYKP